jgi:drug/metabolite transporter (DMT)-like permease
VRYAFFAATFAAVVWGLSFIATKVAVVEVSPITIIWLRFTIGFAFLGVAVLIRRQLAWPAARDLPYLALLGFIGTTLHQLLQATGLKTIQANTTAWIVATIPVFTALLGWLFLKEKIKVWGIIGIVLAAIGVALVVTDGDLGSLVSGGAFSLGDGLVLMSAPNWAIFSVFSRRGLRAYPPALMMFYVMGLGWLLNSTLFLARHGFSELANLSIGGWLGIIFLGVFCSGMAYIFWYDALQVLPVAQTSVFIYLEPLVTAAAAAVLLAEPLLVSTLVGGMLILLGVWIVQSKG